MHACRRRCARTNAVVTARSCGDTPHRRADRRQGRVEHASEAIGCRFARRLHADASQHPAAAACQACRRLCVSIEKRVLVAGWHRCLSTRARRRRGFCDKSVGEVRPSGGAVAQCEHPSSPKHKTDPLLAAGQRFDGAGSNTAARARSAAPCCSAPAYTITLLYIQGQVAG